MLSRALACPVTSHAKLFPAHIKAAAAMMKIERFKNLFTFTNSFLRTVNQETMRV